MKALRLPLLLFALPAALALFAPTRHTLLLLDRTALGAGECWRLWTGHWIHFSGSHLAWNLAVLLAAGTWLERLRPGLLLRHTIIAAPLVGLAILAGEPALQCYGGLSGLATGVVVLLGLHQCWNPHAPRWPWAGLLVLVAIKTIGDVTQADTLLVAFGQPDVRPSSTAHLAGAVIALMHYGAGRFTTSRLFRRMSPGPATDSPRQGSSTTPLRSCVSRRHTPPCGHSS